MVNILLPSQLLAVTENKNPHNKCVYRFLIVHIQGCSLPVQSILHNEP